MPFYCIGGGFPGGFPGGFVGGFPGPFTGGHHIMVGGLPPGIIMGGGIGILGGPGSFASIDLLDDLYGHSSSRSSLPLGLRSSSPPHSLSSSSSYQSHGGEQQSRAIRLASCSLETLYHQTDEYHARLIESEGRLRRGDANCYAGSGIYFAVSKEDTNHKARNKGVILKFQVRLGKVKHIYSSDPSLSYPSLLAEGYDSVMITGLNGPEYVVYNYDQISLVGRV